MEPIRCWSRPSGMKATRSLLVLAAGALLAGCGAQTEPGTTARESTSPSPSSSPSSPSASPTVGSYPAFAPTDYDFTLRLSCFCGYANDPIRVKVRGGAVTSARFLTKGYGHKAGARAPITGVTLNDIIDAANDTTAAQVEVRWPAGQDYPTSVYVDQNTMTADEEIGYAVSHVRVLD